MSLTKTELEETIEALRQELQSLHRENRQLGQLLNQASAQYQQLYSYVESLREWVSDRAA